MTASTPKSTLDQSLEELEGAPIGDPQCDSHLGLECRRLYKLPLRFFTPGDLHLMIGQQFGLSYLVPMALTFLHTHPLRETKRYPGDLAYSLLSIKPRFWHNHPYLHEQAHAIATCIIDKANTNPNSNITAPLLSLCHFFVAQPIHPPTSSHPPSISPPQTIFLPNSLNLIDIRGQGFDTALLICGKPLYYTWDACEGTPADNVLQLRITQDAQPSFNFRQQVSDTPPPGLPLSSWIPQLLHCLAPGIYQLSLQQLGPNDEDRYSYSQPSPDKSCLLHSYLGEGLPYLHATQPQSALSPQRVEYFKQQIQIGKSPVPISLTTSVASCEFIIDGHHKIAAYRELNKPFQRLVIARQCPPYITLAEARSYFPPDHLLPNTLHEPNPTRLFENNKTIYDDISRGMSDEITPYIMDQAHKFATEPPTPAHPSWFIRIPQTFPELPNETARHIIHRTEKFLLSLHLISPLIHAQSISLTQAHDILSKAFPEFSSSTQDRALHNILNVPNSFSI